LTDLLTTRLLAAARRALAASWGPCAGETLVAALSGGPDSVALADALVVLGRESGFRIVLAHLDHQLRAESAEDARFCLELASSWGVPVRIGGADVRARAAHDHAGIEDAARQERYAFLRTVRDEVGARFIALGHTRDDQAETFLLRLLRGSGTDGLASMRAVSGDLLRPLLEVSRAEVMEHLAARGLRWREDGSNADTALLRNRVRHELLPYLETRFNPAVRDTLARSAALLASDADALDGMVPRAAVPGVVAVPALREAPVAIGRRMLRRAIEDAGGLAAISSRHIDAVRALALSPSPSGHRVMLPGGRQALVTFDEVRIGPAATPGAAYSFPLPVPGRVALPGGLAIVAEPVAGALGDDENTAVIAAEEPLVVRTRQAGDRVRVGRREMSLKRFLMSRQVPSTDRGALPLVAAGNRVLWIPGLAVPPAGNDGPRVHVQLERRA
jgi:tRNA(Ile)-lysidine synthase